MATIDYDQRQAQIAKFVKWGFLAVGCALTAPFAFMALEGALAWGAAALAVFVIWNFAPVVGMAVATYRIKAIKALAEANPIETMETLYQEKVEEFDRQETAVTEFETQFRNVSDLVDGLKKTDPQEAIGYAEMCDKMKEGLDELRSEQRAAQAELKNASAALDKMRRIWKVAQAMNKALTSSVSAQQQVFAKIRGDVAVDTIRTNLNRAFANLNTAVERRRSANLFATPPDQPAPAQLAAPEKATVIQMPAAVERVPLNVVNRK